MFRVLYDVALENSFLSGRLNFEYDALGRRTRKKYQDFLITKNSYDKRFIYDREDLAIEVVNNKITAFYVHAPGIDNPIAMMRDHNNNQKYEDNEVYYFTKDHLGSAREIIVLDGKIKQRQRYTAYGKTTKEKNDSEMTTILDQPYGYTSREHDSEAGLYFYRARYYSPDLERFVSEDPSGIFDSGDYNLYRYVRNSSLIYKDYNGKRAVSAACFTTSIVMTASSFLDALDYSIEFSIEVQKLTLTHTLITEKEIEYRRSRCKTEKKRIREEIKVLQNIVLEIMDRQMKITSDKAKSFSLGIGFGLMALGCALLPI